MDLRLKKRYLHWLFLVVGVVSIITLALSVHTYFSMTTDGYGLDVKVEELSLVDGEVGNWLFLKLNVTNPGKLDIYLNSGVLTLGSGGAYDFASDNPHGLPPEMYPLHIPDRETSPMLFWFELSQEDYDLLQTGGETSMALHWNISIPFRSATTVLTYEASVEVGP